MPNFIRSLSQKFRKRVIESRENRLATRADTSYVDGLPSSCHVDKAKGEVSFAKCAGGKIQCKIRLPDSTDICLGITEQSLGMDLYRRVFDLMGIVDERDYFGLQFFDPHYVQHWLDPAKRISKQLSTSPPYTLHFKVKFFPPEPVELKDEMTRYQFFLQLKADIRTGVLECPAESCVELAALALQSEFGDYNENEHDPIFVSEFCFHPQQDDDMDHAILGVYASPLCGGLSPAQAEAKYLEKAKRLEYYGVDMHKVEGRDGNAYTLGLTPYGMLVLDGRQKIGQFLWGKIQKLSFHDKKLTLVVEEDIRVGDAVAQIQLHTFVFELSSTTSCKHLWKCGVEYHSFFRMKFRSKQQPSRVTNFFRLGSTFRYRGRTEYENRNSSGSKTNDTERKIERKASQRKRRCPLTQGDYVEAPSSLLVNSNSTEGERDHPAAARSSLDASRKKEDTVPASHVMVIRIEGDQRHAPYSEQEHSQPASNLSQEVALKDGPIKSGIPRYSHRGEEKAAKKQTRHRGGKRTEGISLENGGFCGDSSAEEDINANVLPLGRNSKDNKCTGALPGVEPCKVGQKPFGRLSSYLPMKRYR